MFFRQKVNDDASLSYFFGCGGQGKGIAVDVVAGDEGWYLDLARKLNASITMVFDTHIHADHLSGGHQLADANYHLHESNLGKTGYSFITVAHSQVLSAGNTLVQVLHTPGHTKDCISLLVSDLRRGPLPCFVLTGDTLFVVGAVLLGVGTDIVYPTLLAAIDDVVNPAWLGIDCGCLSP